MIALGCHSGAPLATVGVVSVREEETWGQGPLRRGRLEWGEGRSSRVRSQVDPRAVPDIHTQLRPEGENTSLMPDGVR